MKLYNYHKETGLFVSESDAEESPLEPGVFLIPANATTVEPPAFQAGYAAVFNGSLWEQKIDNRGIKYYLPDGSRHEITEYGIDLPVGSTAVEPDFVIRNKLLASINAERNMRWRGGFPVLIGGAAKWFHSDEFSLTQHLGLKDKARDLLAAGGVMADNITIAGQSVAWSTMDGSQVQITAQVAFDIVAGGALNQALIFAASQAHEAAINNPATDLTVYDVAANWPVMFGE